MADDESAMRAVRQRIRFSHDVDVVTVMLPDGSELAAEVLDESFGGISLLVTADAGIPPDAAVTILYRSFRLPAVMRYRRAVEASKHRVGFAWLDTKTAAPP